MPDPEADILESLTRFPPFDLIPEDALAALAPAVVRITADPGQMIVYEGDRLDGLYVIEDGTVDIETGDSELIAHRGPGDVIGERGLLRLGRATLTARASSPVALLLVPKAAFHDLMDEVPAFADWFQRAVPGRAMATGDEAAGLTALSVSDLMTRTPVTCPVDVRVTDVARIMRDNAISSVIVMDGEAPAGIVTVRDLTNKVLADGLDGATPVARIMTSDLITIAPDALGLDALMTLADHNISHLPVADHGRIVGLIGRTDLFRQQAATASHMIVEIVDADAPEDMARVVAEVPALLAQLVRSGVSANAISRRITDITDAMIVGRLFELMFGAGVTVVTTSNRVPGDLYKDGLQRDRFVPFIRLIEARLEVLHLASPTDYRQNRLTGADVYFTPADRLAREAMEEIWRDFTGGEGAPLVLRVQGRDVEVPQFHNGVARASFWDLCARALGPADYLAIAEAVRVLILEDIPRLSSENYNEARRFVTLVDALYEARVRLIASAADVPELLYLEGEGSFEFERTASRLREMQGADWGRDGAA